MMPNMQVKIILFESSCPDTQKYTQPIELLYTDTKVTGKNLYQLDVLPDANWKNHLLDLIFSLTTNRLPMKGLSLSTSAL